jgi:uncharacterized protein YlzI (FlbEa/FlbD family)
MLVHFNQGQRTNEHGKQVDATIAINPVMVATVQRSRDPDWSVIIMANGREHAVVGSVMEVIERLNRVEFLATMDQG